MYLKFSKIIFALAVPLEAAASHVLHEKRDTEASSEWIKRDLAPRGLSLPVRIGMTQSNLEAGVQLLMEISSPSSPKYGQHLSAQEVHDLFAPPTHAFDAITLWLKTNLPDRKISQSVNKQWVQLEASPEELESLFQTTYHVWEHLPSSKETIACDEYSIPHELVEHIDYITPGIKLRMPNSMGGSSNPRERRILQRHLSTLEPQALEVRGNQYQPRPQPFHGYKYCAHEMTPQCIQALYNVTTNFSAVKGNDIGVYAISDDQYQPKALEGFFEKLYPQIPKETRPLELFIDSTNYSIAPNDGELALDIHMAYPLIYPQNLTIWYVDDEYYQRPQKVNKTIHDYNPMGIFNSWLDALDGSYCNYTAFGITGNTPGIDPEYPDHHPGGWDHPLQCGVYKPLPVMSISYSHAESWLPVRYLKRQCNEYLKLGLQGTSILFSTGDTGAGGGSGSKYPLSFNHCEGKARPRDVFGPSYPASCPYVTGVGATVLPVNSSIYDYPEVTSYQSSGGFSNIWPTPDYQKEAVTTFLTKYPPGYKSYSTQDGKNIGAGGGRFNRNGRGYPDVSAVGEFVVITGFQGGNVTIEWSGGTSASTPIWAGLIVRINAARLKAGKKTVGFLNPTLYANPEAFHDVTKGVNAGCVYRKDFGYKAAPGWDPTTGLGTPDFGKLIEVFLALP